jgi:hypothetical protein
VTAPPEVRHGSRADVPDGNLGRCMTVAAILKVANCNLGSSADANTIKNNGCKVIEKQQ